MSRAVRNLRALQAEQYGKRGRQHQGKRIGRRELVELLRQQEERNHARRS